MKKDLTFDWFVLINTILYSFTGSTAGNSRSDLFAVFYRIRLGNLIKFEYIEQTDQQNNILRQFRPGS